MMSHCRHRADRMHWGFSAAALLLIMLAPGLDSWSGSRARAQTAPGYSALFEDPPRTDQLTQADIPNLGRLVVLEATSMFVHVRSDLANSPESYGLLDDVTTVWHAADAFVAAVSYYPTEAQSLEAGRLVFPSLQSAYDQLRNTLGRFPGSSERATLNLIYMSRAMAVIPPLLGQSPPAPTRVVPPVSLGPSLAAVRELARELLPLIQALRAEMTKPGPAAEPAADRAIGRELEALGSLVAGLDWIAFGGVADRELVASVRPIRSLAQRIDLRMQRRGLAEPIASQWSAIKQRIDGLAAQFQLPREIVPLAALEKAPLDVGIIAPINEAVNEIETLLERPASAATGAAAAVDLVAVDLRRLRTRLFLLRQYVLGQSPNLQVAQAIRDVETTRRQLEADAREQRLQPPYRLDRVIQSIHQAVTKIRDGLSTPR